MRSEAVLPIQAVMRDASRPPQTLNGRIPSCVDHGGDLPVAAANARFTCSVV